MELESRLVFAGKTGVRRQFDWCSQTRLVFAGSYCNKQTEESP